MQWRFLMNLFFFVCVCVCVVAIVGATVAAVAAILLLLPLSVVLFKFWFLDTNSNIWMFQVSVGWVHGTMNAMDYLCVTTRSTVSIFLHCIHTNTTCAMCIGCFHLRKQFCLKFLRTCCDFVCGTICRFY